MKNMYMALALTWLAVSVRVHTTDYLVSQYHYVAEEFSLLSIAMQSPIYNFFSMELQSIETRARFALQIQPP